MAIVKFSKELQASILVNAKNLFAEKRNAAAKLDTHWTAQSLADFAFQPILDLLKQPEIQPFISKVDSVRVQTIDGARPWERFASSTVTIPAPKRGAIRHPINNPDGSEGEVVASYVYDGLALDFHNVHAVLDLKKAIDERDKRVAEVKVQTDDFVKVVEAVLNTHSTLASALRAWPPLWELLDEKTKAKHKEVTVKAKADKPVLDVDLSAATQLLAMKRMGL